LSAAQELLQRGHRECGVRVLVEDELQNVLGGLLHTVGDAVDEFALQQFPSVHRRMPCNHSVPPDRLVMDRVFEGCKALALVLRLWLRA
jgi:hypothetical protein